MKILLPILLALAPLHGADITVTSSHADGLYRLGETVSWKIEGAANYRILADGKRVIREGSTGLAGDKDNTVSCAAEQPGTLLLEITPPPIAGETPPAPSILAGALVQPEQIPRSAPRPADFDAFWEAKLAELATVPPHPELTPVTNDHPDVSRWQLTLDLPRAGKLRGQLARPDVGEKFPAIIVFQWAGVYGLESWSVNNHAANGWLALNVSAHDLPIDQPKEFYKEQEDGPLKNYAMIGSEDRETSYFLRMFLATSRAVDYLASRPDWDGHTLVVTGTSQGGLQSIVAAALNQKVTALLALVPAGCDATSSLAGRDVSWPGWGPWVPAEKRDATMRTAPYYDGINFASRVKCPALIGYGLLDSTSTPSGVSLMITQLHGPVEPLLMPACTHKGDHAAYNSRATEWLAALKDGNPVPAFKPNPQPATR